MTCRSPIVLRSRIAPAPPCRPVLTLALVLVLASVSAIGPLPRAARTTNKYKPRDDGSTMRALTWQGKDSVVVKDMPIPDITEPKDVIVKVTGSTICGSDLHLYHSEMLGLQKDDILGHEFM